MVTSLYLLRAVRADVANGQWAKATFAQGEKRCLLASTRHHLGWEVFSEPDPRVDHIPIHEYWEATEALAKAIARVFPEYVASDNNETIMNFNDAARTSKRNVCEVVEAAILDIEQGETLIGDSILVGA